MQACIINKCAIHEHHFLPVCDQCQDDVYAVGGISVFEIPLTAQSAAPQTLAAAITDQHRSAFLPFLTEFLAKERLPMMRISAFLFSAVLLTACIDVGKAPSPEAGPTPETETETDNGDGDVIGGGDEDVDGFTILEPLDIPDFDSTTPPPGEYSLKTMLQHIGENVVQKVYERFEADAANLKAAVDAYCSALATDEEATAQKTAKDAMLVAMDTWQIAEMMKMGPAVSAGDGDGLRDEVYSWKDGIGPCAVDKNVMTYHDKGTFAIDGGIPRDYGLDALEYLLFSSDLNSICDSAQTPPEGWSDLSDAEKIAARCDYAALVADHTVADAKNLTTAWRNFINTFVTGNFAQDERDELQGDDMLFHAIALYADKVMKELKLGVPFYFMSELGGKNSTCGQNKEMCAEDLESQFAHISKENMQRNMVGFDMMYYGIGIDGTRGFGFYDLVTAKDSDLAQDIASAAGATKTAVGKIAESFKSLVETGDDNGDAKALFDALNELTVQLRDDIPSSIGLLLPIEMEQDGDG